LSGMSGQGEGRGGRSDVDRMHAIHGVQLSRNEQRAPMPGISGVNGWTVARMHGARGVAARQTGMVDTGGMRTGDCRAAIAG